jgi:hypothetical protein
MLDNVEFSYNNSPHLMIDVSSFYTLYDFHLNTGHFINEEVLKREVLIAQERVEEMIKIRKTLLE